MLSAPSQVPEPALAFRSGLKKEGAPRAVKTDLDQRAPLVRLKMNELARTHTLMVCEDNAPYYQMAPPGLGQVIDAMLVHATATGCLVLDPATATLGDGKLLSAKVGGFVATKGPLAGVAFHELKKGALSTSHPGLALPAGLAKRTCATSRWEDFDGTLGHAVELLPNLVNFNGLTLRSHVPIDKQFDHCMDQELFQRLSDLDHVYGNLDDTSTAVLPLHVWSMLQRPEGGAIGQYEEGPAVGLRALSQRYMRACWLDDVSALRRHQLCVEAPLFEDSLSSDGQWRIILELASRNQQLHRGWYNQEGELGDVLRPFLQGDVGTYKTLVGCIRRQEDVVARGNFASAQEAEANIRALRMACAFDPVIAQMHNQFAILKGNMTPRVKMGSIETERQQQGFSVFKVSREGQGFRTKKELMLRRMLAYLAVLQRRFHIFERRLWLDKVKRLANGQLDRADYRNRTHFLKMVDESNVDEELAGMNKEVFDDTLPFNLEVRIGEVCPLGPRQVGQSPRTRTSGTVVRL